MLAIDDTINVDNMLKLQTSAARFDNLFKKLEDFGLRKSAIKGTLMGFFLGALGFIAELILNLLAVNPLNILNLITEYAGKLGSFLGAGWLLGDSAGVLTENYQNNRKSVPLPPPTTGGFNYALAAKIGFAIGIIPKSDTSKK